MKHTQQSAHGGARDRRDGERRIRNKKMCSLCSIGSCCCCCRCRWCCCCYYCSSTRSTFQVSLRRINFHMQLTRYSGNFSFSAQIICFSPFLKMILCSSLTAFVTDCSTNRLRDEWKWCAPIHLVNNKSIYFWVFFSFFFFKFNSMSMNHYHRCFNNYRDCGGRWSEKKIKNQWNLLNRSIN